MKPLKVGNVSVSSIIEREGPWRAPATMFPTATPEKLVETMARVPDFATIELDIIQVKGKKVGLHVYALMGDQAMAKDCPRT